MIVTDFPTHRERYFAWVFERQRIWYNRMMLGQNEPYTDDSILAKYRFTNSYRELDRGTIYSETIVLPDDGDPTTALARTFMRVLAYRMFNRVSTYDKVFRPYNFYTTDDTVPTSADWEQIRNNLLDLHQEGRNPVFTRAHVIPTFGARAGVDTKIERVVAFLENTSRTLPNIIDGIDVESFQEAHRSLMRLDNLGDFLAFEVLSDLVYTDLLPYDEDSWANPGPGCKGGLALVFGNDLKNMPDQEKLRNLQDEQNLAFASQGLPLGLYAGPQVHSARLTMRNIEGGCCEYYKYNEILCGRLSNRLPFQEGEGYTWT